MNPHIQAKIRANFPDESVFKSEDNNSLFSGFNIPSFIKDYLVQKFTFDETVDRIALRDYLVSHIPAQGSDIKLELMKTREPAQLITRFSVSTNVKNEKLTFSIPSLGITDSDTDIPLYLAQECPDLKGGELWGALTLQYVPPMGSEKGAISLVKYKPFRPYYIDLNFYKQARKQFSLEEWVDVLIGAMEYKPSSFVSMEQKLQFIDRLLVFVQPSMNIIELAPKGTGKSYVFGNLSKFGWLISGGVVSRAKLFYDISKRALGAIALNDFVALDEIQSITINAQTQAALKAYLEQGSMTVANVKIQHDCGMMLMGNIGLDSDGIPRSRNYLKDLPPSFKESALIDRFHGFIEGWNLPRIQTNSVSAGWNLNAEYFSEILHAMRTATEYEYITRSLLSIPLKSDMRDTKAVIKIATARLKLLFPQVTTPSDISRSDFERFCLLPALRMRGTIREQLHYMDAEFGLDMPDIKVK